MGILKTIFAVVGAVVVFGGFLALLALATFRYEARMARKALDSARAGGENVQQKEEDE